MGSFIELVAPTEQPIVMRGQVVGCIPNAGKKTDGPARNFTYPDGHPVTTDVARHPIKVVYRLLEFHILINKLFYVSPSSDEHTSELQSLIRISYAFFCL